MSEERPPDEVLGFYALGGEQGRLDEAYFPLERARTQELVARHLPPPPGVVLDVGGAAGAYAFWLAEQGCRLASARVGASPHLLAVGRK